MPHLVMLYTPQLEAQADLSRLCRKLADAMLSVRDEQGAQVFPTGGTRVLAYPAAHYAVADGSGDHGFIYFNVRMAQGPQRRRAPGRRRDAGRPWCARNSRRCWPRGRWA